MNLLRSALHGSVLLAAPLLVSLAVAAAQTPTHSAPAPANKTAQRRPNRIHLLWSRAEAPSSGKIAPFVMAAMPAGGESGPDLTRSKLVTEDVDGDKIGAVVRNGRPDKGMPHFDFSERQILGLTAFIHSQQNTAITKKGGRKGVDVSDLQTGNAEAGKQYFDGAGGCATCHSPTGDLAGIASRYQGLELEEQMLYPKHAKSRVTVTLAAGQTITGTLDYLDEFTVGLIDPTGSYRSWRTSDVQYKVDAPVTAHADLLSKYTDADIHNLMAYLQTLR